MTATGISWSGSKLPSTWASGSTGTRYPGDASCLLSGSDPVDAPEEPVQEQGHSEHQEEGERISVGEVQLRHVLEVHPPDAREEGRHGDDRRPGRDRLDDLVLPHADQRQVRLQDRGEELALGVNLLVDAPRVVGNVAKVASKLLGYLGKGAPLERLQGGEQGKHRAVKLDHISLQEVDALTRIALVGEDVRLHLLDVVVDPGADRLIIVHDLIEDRPGPGRRARVEELRVLALEALPSRFQ